ncbi:MAG: 3'-5' exonuclease, partial [Planctomycetota bacterium]
AAAESGTEQYRAMEQVQKTMIQAQLAQCRRQLEYAIGLDGQYCDGGYVTDHVQQNYLPTIETIQTLLEQDRFDLCASHVAEIQLPRMPGFKKKQWPEHIKDLIKQPIDAVKDCLKELADYTLLCRSYEQRLAPQAAMQTKAMLELMQRFDALYAAAKQRRNVLDFADLEHRALALLQSHPETAEKLRERFEFIFVDEYQDINEPQQKILEQVSRPDNVFVVGDVKQSIYGFRQSRPEIFLAQLEQAAEDSDMSLRVDLRDNFRCRPEIINFANALFGRTMTPSVAQMDYDKRAELVNGFDYPPFEAKNSSAHPVELVLMDEQESERPDTDGGEPAAPVRTVTAAQRQAAWIARRIEKIVGKETGTPEFQVYDKAAGQFRDVQYRDIVILMRSLSHKAQDYTEMLRLAGIPVSSQSGCGYFEATEITDCLTLLKVLDNPDRDIELAALLRGPVFGVTDTELAQIRMETDKHDRFLEAVQKYIAGGSDVDLIEKLQEIISQIRAWRRQIQTGSLANFLDGVFRERGLLAFYTALPNGSQRRANLLKLHDHAIRFEHFRTTEPGAALGRFVEFLEKLNDAQQDWAPAEPDGSTQDAVRIMSIHKSKGLEFPVVFVAELNTPFNMRDACGACLIDEQMLGLQVVDDQTRMAFPTMTHQIIAEQTRRRNLAEEMRILYVALTRAREKLILTGGKKQDRCTALLTQCAHLPDILPEWILRRSRCHLDWVLAGFAGQFPLRRLFGTDAGDGLHDDGLFAVERIDRDRLEAITQGIRAHRRQPADAIAPPGAGSSGAKEAAAAARSIRQNLAWQYPFSDITKTPAKLSVSALTHRDDEFSAADMQGAFLKTPAALNDSADPKTAAGALSLGSAVHLIIEKIDLSRQVDTTAVRSTIAGLVERAQLTKSLAAAVDVAGIVSFFDSDLGQLTQRVGTTVLREWPFTYALDAAVVGAESGGETVVLQGIVDMIIPTEAGLVIVDFKTDRVAESGIATRAEKYAEQVRLYAQAAAAILNQPVTAAWLYFLTLQKAVEIKPRH